ncbi:hypothetical protein GC163_01470 [bacterium]|nr:hypothetical protein [bacterium]
MSELTPTTAVPPHVRWFAPWTWSRKQQLLLVCLLPLLPILYALSGGPAMQLVDQNRVSPDVVEILYRPLLTWDRRFFMSSQYQDYSYGEYLGYWSWTGYSRVLLCHYDIIRRDQPKTLAPMSQIPIPVD